MNLKTLFLTNNDCYKSGKRHTVKGIMVHSTGANNPWLKRYVGPDDGLLGPNPYNNHWNTPKPDGRSVCVHAFIGKLQDGSIATYQTLPWDMVGWHSGSGSLGSAKNANNNGYIGFEICEDDLTDASYFNKVYTEAVELCAYLCKKFNLDPLADGVLICHSEGSKRGIASNHADVMHWVPRHGKNMDLFRAAVKAEMAKNDAPAQAGHPIIGKPTATVGQAKEWAKNSGATSLFISLADIFWKLAPAAGVDPAVAYCQSAKETGYGKFGGVLNETFKNPCGMKTKSGGSDGDPNAHQRFASWEEGIQAQIDHLALYAGAAGYPKPGTPDPRHFPYLKGTAPTVEQLGGKWAPSASYGTDIVAMMNKLKATKEPAPAPAPAPGTLYYVQTGAYSNKANADAQYYKVKAAGYDAIIKQSGGLFRVQVGAFSVKQNAENLAAKLKAAGFETYITTTGGTQVAPGPELKQPAAKPVKVGSEVKIKASATKYATGQTIPGWVKDKTHIVSQISGDRVLLGANGGICSWVYLNDVEVVK